MLSGKVISVISGKGGVGKSTVSANLAVSLSRQGKSVGLIDFDIYGSSIPNMMNISFGPKSMNNKIIPVESHGVKIMSMGFIVKNNDPVVWRGPMLGKVINQFINEVIWGPLDYVVIDMPPGTGDVAMDVNRLIPSSHQIVVTTPHPTASHVAERAGKMAAINNHNILGIVENIAYFQPPDLDQKYYLFGRGGYKRGSLLFDKYNDLADKVQDSIA